MTSFIAVLAMQDCWFPACGYQGFLCVLLANGISSVVTENLGAEVIGAVGFHPSAKPVESARPPFSAVVLDFIRTAPVVLDFFERGHGGFGAVVVGVCFFVRVHGIPFRH
jgi:hypothetical protein